MASPEPNASNSGMQSPWLQTVGARYLLALAASAAAVGIKWSFDHFLDMRTPFLFLFSVVFLSAIYGGVGPGILAMFLTLIAGQIFLAEAAAPLHASLFHMGLYVAESLAVIVVCSVIRRTVDENMRLTRDLRSRIQAVRESETRFRHLFENSRDGIGLSSGGKIVYVNQAYADLLGYDDPAEMAGLSVLDMVAPEDQERMTRRQESRAQGEAEPELYTFRAIRKDGVTIDLENHISAYVENGERYTLVVARDVTERNRAEEAVRDSERQLRLIIDAAPTLIAYVDREERFRYNNKAYSDWFGLEYADLTGKPVREMIGEKAYQQSQPYREAAWRGEFAHFERMLDFKEGGPRFLKASFAPDIGPDGAIRGYIVVATDITATKRQEETQRFLARAGETLASSLDYLATLAAVSDLTVPHLADWCAVDLLDEDGELKRVATSHADPARRQWAEEIHRRYPTRKEAIGGPARVARTGETEWMADIPPELVRAGAKDEAHFRLLKEAGLRSYISVPLIARERTIGVISVILGESGRRYTAEDVVLMENLAHRVALAVDNARLYEAAQREIAERERAQEALQESETRLRIALESAHMGLWLSDRETGRLESTPTCRINVGLKPEDELTYERLFELIHPDDRENVRRAGQEARVNGTEYHVEYRTINPAGEVNWVSAHGRPRFREGGAASDSPVATQMLGVTQNITARKKAEEAQRELAALLNTILETAPIGFAFFDRGLRFMRVNAALAEINGLPLEAHIGWTVPEILPEMSAEVAQDLARVLETGEPVLNREVVGETPAAPGERRYWLASYYPVRASEGGADPEILGIGAVVVEITERKRTEAEIRALNARLRRAMTETHHRVKNNLQVVSALIDLQTLNNTETLPAAEFTRLGQHVRSLAVVHDLLTGQAKADGEAHTISARQVLEKLLPMIQQMAGHRELRFRIGDAIVSSRQGTALALVTNEICSNAIKHGRSAIDVTFEARDGPGGAGSTMALLEVCDDGPGFPDGFDPLRFAHTGLELVVNLTTWDLEGQIRFENRAEGGGRVVVTFPLNVPAPIEAASPLSSPADV